MNENKTIGTLADVLSLIDQTGLTGTRRRDMISAIKRICEMAGTTPECVCAGLPVLKEMLSRIRPAAHGVSAKSYSNLRSLLAAALELAGVINPSGRGRAIRAYRTGSPPSRTGAPVRASRRARWKTAPFSAPPAMGTSPPSWR